MDNNPLNQIHSWSKSYFGAVAYTFRCQENMFFDPLYLAISLLLYYLIYFAYLVDVLNFHMMYQFALIYIKQEVL